MSKQEHNLIRLSSTKSINTSLEDIRRGRAGLNKHRQILLERVPKTNDWANFKKDSVSMKDIAFLTAKTGDEFAILKGKKDDILFHGSKQHCEFEDSLSEMLRKKHLKLYGHSHPIESFPIPSEDDRKTLKSIGQKKSRLISSVTGREIEFSDDEFELIYTVTERSGFGDVDI